MTDKVTDLSKVRFMKSMGRDLLLYERLAGGALDVTLHRIGGIRGLFVPSEGRGTITTRAKVFRDLITFGIAEQEMLEALVDAVTRRGGTLNEAKLHFATSITIYRCDEVQKALKDWGLDTP
jgi:hypothetical protein